MNGWAWIILTGAWLGALAAAVSGVVFMAWAVLGRRKQPPAVLTQTAAPNTAEVNAICWADTGDAILPRRACCDCCGYQLAGLESGLCPECGWSYETSRVPRNKRRRAVLAGFGLLVAAAVLWQTPTAARDGLAAAAPSGLLAASLPYLPWSNSAAHRELANRADRESLSPWSRSFLAEQCADILASRRDDQLRFGAAGLLLKVRGDADAAATTLLTCLNDPSAEVRGCAADVLAAIAGHAERRLPSDAAAVDRPGILDALARAAIDDPSAAVRRRALDGLSDLNTLGQHATVFASATHDRSPVVRERALYALHSRWVRDSARGLGTTATVSSTLAAVETATHDQHADVRVAAVYTLGRLSIALDNAVLSLAPALHDPSPDVRRQAAEHFCFLGRRAAPAWADLMLSLDDEDPAVQEAAMQALRALNS